MNIFFNERGQALVESIVAILAFSMILMGSLSTLYVCFSKLWLRHCTHEALICMASDRTAVHCQNKFIKNMHEALPFGRLMVDEFFTSPDDLSVKARWSFGMKDDLAHRSHFRITEHQELSLPLTKRL